MFRQGLTFSQALGLLLTVIVILIALGLPLALIGHASESDLAMHPVVLGMMNVVAIGYVIRQSVVKSGEPIVAALRLTPVDPRLAPYALAVLAGTAILVSELDNLLTDLIPMPKEMLDTLLELSTGKHGLPATIFLLNVVAPVTEELLFRGIILRGFLITYRTRTAILLSALLFALFHFNIWQGVGAFLLGVIFGWWYVRTASVVPCLVGHALFNAVPVVFYGILGFDHPDFTAPVEYQPLWLDALGVLLLVGGAITLERAFRMTLPVPAAEWLETAKRFGDRLLEHARDDYGDETTPLFVSQVDVRTQAIPDPSTRLYATDTRGGAGPTTNNLQFDGGLLRLLYGLTDTTGDAAYATAADDYLAWYLERLPSPSGYFPWGDHRGYDVVADDVVDGHGEFKVALPVWDRMWAIDPEAVVRQADALDGHVIDRTRSLAFNGHYPPGSEPHSMNSSAGAWILLWTFVYARTDDRAWLDRAVSMADYLWSLRNPDTDLLAAHPYDPAWPETADDPVARGRASRTEYLGPMYWYAVNLLRADRLVPLESTPFTRQALAYVRAFTSRFDPTPDGHFHATFDIATGEPLFDRITDGWQITSQAREGEPASGVVGLRAPIALAAAYALTLEDDLSSTFATLTPLFRIPDFVDLDRDPHPVSAGLLAQAIGAWTNLYAATSDYAYLGPAIVLGRYAARHYVKDDWFVCGPPTVLRYRDGALTGWEVCSNRGGSHDLSLALLRLSAIADGRHDLIEHDPLCYF